MEITLRTAIHLATGICMEPDADEVWSACDYILQKSTTNVELASTGYNFVSSVMQEQHPDLASLNCSSVKDKESCDAFIEAQEARFGKTVKIEPADRVPIEMSDIEHIANVKGTSIEEIKIDLI